MAEGLFEHCRYRLHAARRERDSWLVHWREIAEYLMPRRYRHLPTPNGAQGGKINNRILDETGTLALTNLRGGLMSGITSPARPWFELNVSGFNPQAESQAAQIWLDEVVRRMQRVMAESNFYAAMGDLYLDLASMGTAVAVLYEDFENVVNCTNPVPGEFVLWNDAQGRPGGLGREFTFTAAQIKARWPEAAGRTAALTSALDQAAGRGLHQEFTICHIIEANDDNLAPKVPARMPWREAYWLQSATEAEGFLEVRGFFDKPFLAARWDKTGNDAYGRSPAMDALPAVKQLQQMTKRGSQAIDKMTNPPLRADSSLRNKPATSLPGGITYVDGMTNERPGFQSLYEVRLELQPLLLEKQAVQARIKEIFFNDLFLTITSLDTVRTATEIDARREEKLVMLGPVLQRFEGEVLDPAISRIFGIMLRGGLLPPAPPELQGQPIHTDYVSPLAQAQRASATSAIERVLATAGNLAAVNPAIMDIIDDEETLREYGSVLTAPARMFRDPKVVAAIRTKREQQQQQAALLEQTLAGANAAKTLSGADVGGGQNALAAMLGGPAA